MGGMVIKVTVCSELDMMGKAVSMIPILTYVFGNFRKLPFCWKLCNI
jgi:hypothetical protein